MKKRVCIVLFCICNIAHTFWNCTLHTLIEHFFPSIFWFSFVDGFLIGVACALSRRAGWILALANCLEMSFLGMAVSMRVRKCTGSTQQARYACIIVPPLIMLGATILGAVVGSVSKAYPILFVTFVAFGVIALLYLVFNELLAEAREAQEGDVRWWVTAIIFVGIYVVLMMDQIIA